MDMSRRLRLAFKRLAIGGVGQSHDGERVAARLGLRPGMWVADIGAGFGDFAVRFATAVGSDGRVFAVDLDPDLRDAVARQAADRKLPQLLAVAATPDDASLPGPVDVVFLSSTFHHLPDPVRWFSRLRPSLRPGGTVAILETRPTLLSGWFGHATAPEAVRSAMERAGFRLLWRDDLVRVSSFQAFGAIEQVDPAVRAGDADQGPSSTHAPSR